MALSDPPSQVGGIALLERAVGYTLGSLSLVTTRALGDESPCSGWTLQALLGHMDDSFAALCEAADAGTVTTNGHDGARADRTVEVVRSRARQLLAAWSRPDIGTVSVAGYPLSATVAAVAGAVEVAVHGWDVARACGKDRPLPVRLATELLDVASLLITDADRPTRFDWPVRVPAGSGSSDRLLAFTGRQPTGCRQQLCRPHPAREP